MKKTLTTTKQIVLGLGVAFLAVAFSSFKSTNSDNTHFKPKKAAMAVDAYILQGATSFTQSTSFSADNCEGSSTRYCGYDVTSSGQTNITNAGPYSASDIDTYVTNGWLIPDPNSSKGVYNP